MGVGDIILFVEKIVSVLNFNEVKDLSKKFKKG